MNQVEKKADTFLRMIRRAQRGHLKVYLGYAAGVGKTYQMLLEGRRLRGEGIDVVVGFVETHGRIETQRLLEGLEVIPHHRQEYRGIILEEMAMDARSGAFQSAVGRCALYRATERFVAASLKSHANADLRQKHVGPGSRYQIGNAAVRIINY